MRACREAFPEALRQGDRLRPDLGRQTSALSFIVNRPSVEHGFKIERTDDSDRVQRYRLVHLREAIGSVGVGNSALRGNSEGSITE